MSAEGFQLKVQVSIIMPSHGIRVMMPGHWPGQSPSQPATDDFGRVDGQWLVCSVTRHEYHDDLAEWATDDFGLVKSSMVGSDTPRVPAVARAPPAGRAAGRRGVWARALSRRQRRRASESESTGTGPGR